VKDHATEEQKKTRERKKKKCRNREGQGEKIVKTSKLIVRRELALETATARLMKRLRAHLKASAHLH